MNGIPLRHKDFEDGSEKGEKKKEKRQVISWSILSDSIIRQRNWQNSFRLPRIHSMTWKKI